MEEGKFAYVAVVLTIIWVALIYSPGISMEAFLQEFIAGVIVAVAIAAITAGNFEGAGLRYFHPRRVAYFIAFLFIFLIEMIKANLNMAKIVLSPKLPVKPGIVEIETELKQPSARLFLGNAITLTPGTMTLDYKDNKAYIHWVYVESEDSKKAGEIIKGKFEKFLKEVYS